MSVKKIFVMGNLFGWLVKTCLILPSYISCVGDSSSDHSWDRMFSSSHFVEAAIALECMALILAIGVQR